MILTPLREAAALRHNPFQDTEATRVWKDKMVTARKERPCTMCPRVIQIGERYRSRFSHEARRTVLNHAVCSQCCFNHSEAQLYAESRPAQVAPLQTTTPPSDNDRGVPLTMIVIVAAIAVALAWAIFHFQS